MDLAAKAEPFSKVARPAACALAAASALLVLAACESGGGDLSVVNESGSTVTVSTGDEQFDVSADGGVVLLDYGCTPSDVTVELASGRVVTVAGPVCPDQQIVVQEHDVELTPSP